MEFFAEILQSIGQTFVNGYNGIENFFVNGWASWVDFLLNTLGLKAFWEIITNISV